MSGDRLADAVRALREETAEQADAGQFTRARIMASVRERRRRRVSWVTALLPIAAVLVVGSALATVSGGVPAMLQRLVGHTEQVPAEPAVTPPQSLRAPSPPTPVEPAAASDLEEPSVEPEVAKVEAPPRPVVATATQSAAASTPAPPVAEPPPAVESADLSLYRAAHQKHFQQGDYPGAIAAYERYLAESPRGRFVLEASYNRALCLIRVGRTGEAKTALEPFAEGRYGAYRRDEARQLLNAMQGRDAEAGL